MLVASTVQAPALAGSSSAAGVPVTSSGQFSTHRFDDWELICPSAANAPAAGGRVDSCRLQQAQAIDGAVAFLFNVVLQQKPIAVVSTPLNVYLPAGLSLKIDGGTPARAVFETCSVTGCHAGFPIEPKLLASLRRGKMLTVTLRDSKASEVPVKVSLKGFSAGLTALEAR